MSWTFSDGTVIDGTAVTGSTRFAAVARFLLDWGVDPGGGSFPRVRWDPTRIDHVWDLLSNLARCLGVTLVAGEPRPIDWPPAPTTDEPVDRVH